MSLLLTPEEAAKELAISVKQLRLLTQDGAIAYVNIGRGTARETRRYDPADIAAFVEARRTRSSTIPAMATGTALVHDFDEIRRGLKGRSRK